MVIQLFYNSSENNKVDKSLTLVRQIEGNLKNQTSLIDPVIMIEGSADVMTGFNYMYIPDFKRFYFVNNVVNLRTNLFQINAHVDVLSTYKNEIRGNRAIVRKQEKAWNLYLDDGTFRTYQNRKIVLKQFPAGFSGHSYVLLISGS